MDRVVLRVGGSILILTVSALGTVGQSVPRERVSKTAACTAALEKGKHLIVEHSLREAQQVLVEAAGSCPDAPELLNALGMAYDKGGQYEEAQAAFSRAIWLNPFNAGFHNNLAASYIRSGKQATGIAEFRKALGLDPGNLTAGLNLGSLYLQKKQYRRALIYLEAAQARRSQDPLALLELTEAYFGVGKAQQALETATRLARLPGADARIHFSLGLLLAEHGEYQLAAGQFEAIPPAERDVAADMNLGMTYTRLGRFEQAHSAYGDAIRLDPQNPDPYFQIGADESAEGKHQSAVDWMTEAHDKAPDRPDISYALAEELIHSGNFERAHSLLTLAMASYPHDAALREAVGDLYGGQNQLQDAVKAYDDCLRLDSGRVSARLSLARAYEGMRQTEKARAALDEVLGRDPKNAEAEAQLGRLALEAGNEKDASALIEGALSHDPNNLSANEYLARLQIRAGRLTEAWQTLEKLVMREPQSSRFHFLLGSVLARLNQPEEAEKEFELSKRLKPKQSGPEEE
ncbi:MAG: hypothetical protein AUG75_04685 [Cyanobacteria bacterium 13_1_20CM_4_61_6]|nr:MAG: hypothetical protein AUG75_04685 [Cyanobacteria bacterium 13_1_20CM_4_61_6]